MKERETVMQLDGESISATESTPETLRALVVFAHGSGSSRRSPRNRFVAHSLNARGFATLLVDLLTPSEENIDRRTAVLRFDIALLARRVDLATSWAREREPYASLPIGYFGASTGAAAALLAAANRTDIAAVVSRGGRPDLAGPALSATTTPTLLIVGERDATVLDLNRRAASQIHAVCEIAVVPRASHLFEEPGALEEVARLAQDWFSRYLVKT